MGVPDLNKDILLGRVRSISEVDTERPTYVTRRPGEACIEAWIEPKFQRIETIMVWECIMGDQKGTDHTGQETGHDNGAESHFPRPSYIYFQQDGAPVHRA
jgi:hypothetical protein